MKLRSVSMVLVTLAVFSLVGAAQVRRQKPAPVAPPVAADEAKRAAAEATQSRANLIVKTETYRDSLNQVLELQKREQDRLATLVEVRRNLLTAGIIARREFDETQALLADASQRINETGRQIDEANQLVNEVLAAEEMARIKPEPPGTFRSGVTLIRYSGTGYWSLDGYSGVDAFFRESFGRALPVSAFGQSGTHDRLGFDHRGALDVSIHPDTAEGQTLMAYLRSQGVPFIAFRAAVAGSATGAHIHIGPPSHRASSQ